MMKLSSQDINNAFYDYNVKAAIEDTSQQIVQYLMQEYEKNIPLCFLIGKGLNGTDGACIVQKLIKEGFSHCKVVTPYALESLHSYTQEYLKQIDNVVYSAHEIPNSEIYIEALVGTGFEGSVVKRPLVKFGTALKKTKKFVLCIDTPLGNIQPDTCLSISTPKIQYSQTFTSIHTKKIESLIGPGDVYTVINKNHIRNWNNIILFSEQLPELSKSFARRLSCELEIVSLSSLVNNDIRLQEIESLLKDKHVIVINLQSFSYLNMLIIDDILKSFPNKKYIFVTNTETLPNSNILLLQDSLVISGREVILHKSAQSTMNLSRSRVISFTGETKQLPSKLLYYPNEVFNFAVITSMLYSNNNSFQAAQAGLFLCSLAQHLNGSFEERIILALHEINDFIATL